MAKRRIADDAAAPGGAEPRAKARGASAERESGPARVVLILGSERTLREEAIARIRKASFADGDGGLSFVALDAGVEAGGSEKQPLNAWNILDEAAQPSLFGNSDEPKLVLVRRADALLNDAEQRTAVEDMLPRLPEQAKVIFEVAEAGRLKTTGFYKRLEQAGAVVPCEPLRSPWGVDGPSSPLAQELERRARTLGLTLTPGAAGALIERSGQNLGVLIEELEKLALALGASPDSQLPVDEEQIARNCSDARLAGAFEFADAVAEREVKASLEALGRIFAHGLGDYRRPGRVITQESQIAMQLLGALTWKMTQLQDLRDAMDRGLREFEAFQAAKVFGSSRQDAMRRTLRKHTSASLAKAMDALLRANIELRTGHERFGVLERLIWEIARG